MRWIGVETLEREGTLKKNKRGKKSEENRGGRRKKDPNGLVAYVPWLATNRARSQSEDVRNAGSNTTASAQVTESVKESIEKEAATNMNLPKDEQTSN